VADNTFIAEMSKTPDVELIKAKMAEHNEIEGNHCFLAVA
jgi:hypothetical protein